MQPSGADGHLRETTQADSNSVGARASSALCVLSSCFIVASFFESPCQNCSLLGFMVCLGFIACRWNTDQRGRTTASNFAKSALTKCGTHIASCGTDLIKAMLSDAVAGAEPGTTPAFIAQEYWNIRQWTGGLVPPPQEHRRRRGSSEEQENPRKKRRQPRQ